MKSRFNFAIAILLVLAIVSTTYLGCGGNGGEKGKTIVMGFLTDMTGPASSMLVFGDQAYYDLARDINQNDPIPGARIKIIAYDTQYNPSRDILGYDWVRERGATIVFSGIPTVGDTLKNTAARDKVVIVSSSPSTYQLEPPGWVFGLTPPVGWVMKGFLKWISENDWDYQAKGRKPKIGSVGWDEPYHRDVTDATKQYVSDHPDQFEWVAGIIAPMSTMTWTAQVEKLKNADYIYLPSTGVGIPTFVRPYRDKGYEAKFLGLDAMTAFLELIVKSTGWDYLDGSLTAHTTLYWNDQYPVVDKAKQLLQRYHPNEKDRIMSMGLGYVSIYFCAAFQFELLRQAVKEVGAENFDSQAYYNAAINFNWWTEGLPARGYGFNESVRYARKDFTVYEWKADAQDLVRASDWLPCDNPNP
ncbi:MAG: ABC transporter substrate-binding protein [Chloroflexi bacterium]|nr:ABC transporter substrate-binding protein [Chloroflexota bacterium]